MENGGMIYKLIGQAIGKIGAIGKDKKNAQQGFMYRGIDQVYNALNPVMAELGIFFTPEILDQKREERTTKNGSVLTYTVLTIRFTVFAPDGSNVSMTVVGEGMDSGDKSTNKAMSVAMKYAMFQLFCIPTEEMRDPDADSYTDIQPRGKAAKKKETAKPEPEPVKPEPAADHSPAAAPADEQKDPDHVRTFLITANKALRESRGITAEENNRIFNAQWEALKAAKIAPDKKLGEYTLDEAEALIRAMQTRFDGLETALAG
jgi:hypothetical protein